jgi:selenocysteine-specific elongation factor
VTLVVGTAGHIDHGKTSLLRALTGIDADRLPEERRRGMTIDVGYAHLTLPDGSVVDFVDVPGHDRLVGNMLVGAGEVDVPLLVVAADDGPRAQTLEHLALLDALHLPPGLVVVTKVDAVDPERANEVAEAVGSLLEGTSLAGSPVRLASSVTGEGLEAIRADLASIAVRHRPSGQPPALAVDRVFSVKGRGVVVTGTLRGGPLGAGDRLRVVPGEGEVRVREIQVHGAPVERVHSGGRTALNLAASGVATEWLRRGAVLTADPSVRATDRMLVAFEVPVGDRTRGHCHLGTAATDASVGRDGRDALVLADGRAAGTLRLAAPLGARPGDRFVLRRGPTVAPIGGVVLDVAPPLGISRRRQTPERVACLLAPEPERAAARLDLHGALVDGGAVLLAEDVAAAARASLDTLIAPVGIPGLRASVAASLRRSVSLSRSDALRAATRLVDGWIGEGRLVRDGDDVRPPAVAARALDPATTEAMDRLERALAVPAPPPLGATARAVGCSPDGVRALERAARIVVLEPDLAYAMSTYRDLAAGALRMAASAPLTPAALRDATGTSRKYVMAILEDLDRRALLRRTPEGHIPGPKAPSSPSRGAGAP